jgi:hypothetical protein
MRASFACANIMSGPTTVIFTAEPATVILAAAAIRAAEAVQAAYREAGELRDQHADAQAQKRNRQAEANLAGQNALAEQVDRNEQRYAQLCKIAEPLGATAALRASQPLRPSAQDLAALAAYSAQLRALSQTLEAALREQLGEAATLSDAGIAFEHLAETALQSRAQPASPTAAVRLLAKLAALGPLPEHIENLARELAATSHVERAELLEVELQRAIQLFEQDAAREASALVLEQTLKDLGYQVEPVSDTLFVEGGVVHFRRAGWENYQVRLRLNARESSANFNVIRAVDAGDNERSVLDHIAEDRWCAEFPALLQALAARGLHLDVTRRLAAGELPVQLVDRNKLPKFADEAERPSISAPRQKELG